MLAGDQVLAVVPEAAEPHTAQEPSLPVEDSAAEQISNDTKFVFAASSPYPGKIHANASDPVADKIHEQAAETTVQNDTEVSVAETKIIDDNEESAVPAASAPVSIASTEGE